MKNITRLFVAVFACILASSLATQAMEFDVRVVGNHDYAWGEDELLAYAQDETALVLASNTQYVGEKAQGFGVTKGL